MTDKLWREFEKRFVTRDSTTPGDFAQVVLLEEEYVEFVDWLKSAFQQIKQDRDEEWKKAIEEMKKYNSKEPLCGWYHWKDEVDDCHDCQLVNQALDDLLTQMEEK